MADVSQPAYSVLDLFAGAGGLTRGFVDAGFRAAGAVEWDHDAAASYVSNFGLHLHAGDIERYAQSSSVPQVDVVVGGPPCQGFSNLGARLATDPRNRLWRAYAEVVRRARPTLFVLENVDRFASSEQLGTLRWHCRRGGLLEGYEIVLCEQLNTADFGVAQRRVRTIVIGARREISGVHAPSPTHCRSGRDKPRWKSVSEAFEAPPAVPTRPRGIDLPHDHLVTLRLPDGASVHVRGPFRSDELHLGRRPRDVSLARFRAIPPGGNWRDLPQELMAPCWRNRTTHGSGDVMGRLRADKPAVTIRTEFNKPEKGRYLHPREDRPITHFEAVRLMGFPDDHLWCGSKTSIARQIGNAVPPPLALAVAQAVLATLRDAGVDPRRMPRVA